MLLHAGIAEVVTGSARKRLQPHRPVEFEGSGVNPQGETVLNDTRAFELKLVDS